jgi:hypothetical protein
MYRSNRKGAASSTNYGFYYTGLSTKLRIEGNRIHNMFDFAPASTGTFYGIYFSSCDALAGFENRVFNNAIYSIGGNGSIYGIANSSSDNLNVDHNTISIDDAGSAPASSATARGFSMLGTFTANTVLTQFRNNIVTVTRAGVGSNFAIHASSATVGTSLLSNRNDLFVSGANSHVGFNGVNRTTLSAWQTNATQDANSLSVTPNYSSLATGNLKPLSSAVNNLGTPVGVTTDILGTARNAATPDIGAWEFDVEGCVAPPTPGTTTSSISYPWTIRQFLWRRTDLPVAVIRHSSRSMDQCRRGAEYARSDGQSLRNHLLSLCCDLYRSDGLFNCAAGDGECVLPRRNLYHQ